MQWQRINGEHNKNMADVNVLLFISRRGSQDYVDFDVCAQGDAYVVCA